LEEAGVAHLVEYYAEESQITLPRFVSENRYFDFAFVDGSHLFDRVFLDLIYLGRLVHPGGIIFFGFPPWQMPFGGHQQVCKSQFLGKCPYFHLLPESMYVGILRLFGENDTTQKGLREIRDTGISIERFERILRKSDFSISRRKFWLLNPIYKYKFGKGPFSQFRVISALPVVRNFLTTAVYYVVSQDADNKKQGSSE